MPAVTATGRSQTVGRCGHGMGNHKIAPQGDGGRETGGRCGHGMGNHKGLPLQGAMEVGGDRAVGIVRAALAVAETGSVLLVEPDPVDRYVSVCRC